MIIVPDRKDIELSPRGSKIIPADTYARPAAPPPADTSIGDALTALASVAGDYDKKKEEADDKNLQLYVAQVASAHGDNKEYDPAILNGQLNSAHPRVRARVAENYGTIQGDAWVSKRMQEMPDEIRSNPEAAKAYFEKVRAEALQAAGKHAFYNNGFMTAVNNGLKSRGSWLDSMRTQDWNKTNEDALKARLAQAADPAVPYNPIYAPDKAKAGAVISTAQKLGVRPEFLATVMAFETGGTFNPDLQHSVVLKDGDRAFGLIGFTKANREKYGITPGMGFDKQMDAVGRYLLDRGVKPNASLEEIYRAINPNADIPAMLEKMDKDGRFNDAFKFLGRDPSYFGAAPRPNPAGTMSGSPRANVAKRDAYWGDPDAPDFKQKYLTTLTTKSGLSTPVHKNAAQAFAGFIQELESRGYNIKTLSSHANRDIRGVPGKKSQHAWANALDINAYIGNGFGKGAKTDLPPDVGELAKKHGLAWGGTWKRPDPMHFEYVGPPTGGGKVQVASSGAIMSDAGSGKPGPVSGLAEAPTNIPPRPDGTPVDIPMKGDDQPATQFDAPFDPQADDSQMKYQLPEWTRWSNTASNMRDTFLREQATEFGTMGNNPTMRNKVREVGVDTFIRHALNTNDKTILQAFPLSKEMTPAERTKFDAAARQIDLHVKKELEDRQTREAAEHDAKVLQMKIKVNEKLLKGEPLTEQEKITLNRLDPDLLTGLHKRYEAIKNIRVDPVKEEYAMNKAKEDVRRVLATGGNPAKINFDAYGFTDQASHVTILKYIEDARQNHDIMKRPIFERYFQQMEKANYGRDGVAIAIPGNPDTLSRWHIYRNALDEAIKAWAQTPAARGGFTAADEAEIARAARFAVEFQYPPTNQAGAFDKQGKPPKPGAANAPLTEKKPPTVGDAVRKYFFNMPD